jgi:hypothetical protein
MKINTIVYYTMVILYCINYIALYYSVIYYKETPLFSQIGSHLCR